MKTNSISKISALILPFLFFPILLLADSSGGTIKNPLGSSDVNVLLLSILNIVTKVGSVLVVLFIIYSGYKFVTAGDNEGSRTEARDIFWSTIIGGAVLLGADIIANIVIETVKKTAGVN